jgi:hypothetical protein
MAKIFKLRHNSYTPGMFQHEIDKIKVFNSSHLLVPFAICHDTPNLIILTEYLYGNQTLYHMLHKTSNSNQRAKTNRTDILKIQSNRTELELTF